MYSHQRNSTKLVKKGQIITLLQRNYKTLQIHLNN